MRALPKILTFCIIALFLISCSVIHRNARIPSSSTSGGVASCIRDARCRRVFPVAHRGNGFGAPENSREAVLRSVYAGITIIEIDLFVSRDGIPYVLHDSKLDRTTTGVGLAVERTSDELSRVFLENGEPIPKFSDVYAVSRGRAVLDLDFKGHKAIRPVAEWIAHYGSFDDVLFFVNKEKEMLEAAKMKRLHPKMIVMTRIRSLKDLNNVREIFGGVPEIIHVNFPFLNFSQIKYLHSLKTKVFVNAIVNFPLLQELAFAILIPGEPDFIQSDDPATLQKMLGI